MAYQFKNNLNKGINLDLDAQRLPPDAAVFIKNLTDNVNTNASNPALAGGNQGVRTPVEGNAALTISLPSGTNYCVGFYSAEETNEGYFAIYNSNTNHSLWVIRGDTGAVVKVHQSALLPFLLDSQYFFSEGRMTIELRTIIDPVTLVETNFKFIVFSNNTKYQCLLDVEASIATNSYTTPYFTSSSAFYDPVELIHLTRPLPIKCVKLNDPTPYVPVTDDENKQNMLINSGWQFRIRTWDVYGRPSEWGIISAVFTSLVGGGCIGTSNGLPRCVNLCFDAGNPQTKFITVAFRRGAGNDPSGQTESGWFEHETFRKYDDSTGVQWYNRPINPLFSATGSGITFNAATNIITYSFCADKGSNPVSPTEAARTEPGTPRLSNGVFSVNKRIGLPNNSYQFEPISQDVTDAIEFGLKTPDPLTGGVPCPAPPLRTITVFVNLYRPWTDTSSFIRNSFGIIVFGDGGVTIPPVSTTPFTSNFKLGQIFADQQNPGFIGYLDGTPYKTIAEWGDYNPATGIFTPVTITGSGPASFPNLKMSRLVFKDVPAGKYLVRLASHHATINDGDLQNTSTQVAGVCSIGTCYTPWGRRTGYMSNPEKEIRVDCSGADVNLGGMNDPMFVILDLNNGVRSEAVDGYVRESVSGGPVEMAVCYIRGSTMGTPGDAYGSFFTDHNGYYFAASGSTYCMLDIYVDLCDGSGTRSVWNIVSMADGSIRHGDGTGTRSPDYDGNWGNWRNQVYIARPGGVVTTYPSGANRYIRQKIGVCGSATIGVPGIPVIFTKGKSTLTNSSGLAVLVAHNRYDYLTAIGGATPPFDASLIPSYANTGDYLIFSQKGGCQWNACGTCDTYMADVFATYMACGVPSVCSPAQPARTLCLADLSAQPNGVGIKGLQSGGKYPVAYWCHDVIARHNSPQIRGGDFGYVFVPNLNDTTPSPYPAMALCSLQVTIPGGLLVDPVFTKITFLVGANCLFKDFISWCADWIQYVDNTGTTNNANPTAIRIYFQSLNEYNKQYNFGTNTAWDFVAGTNDPTLPKDVVQFIMNGDGTWLPSIKSVPVTFDKAGSFFTVDYIPELAGLQNGCLFRIIRPNQNTSGTNMPYYEQCLTLDINNGLLPTGTWDIPYQDSYLLSRSVPVPLLKGQTSPVPPGASVTPQYTSTNQDATLATDGFSTNNVNNNNGVVIFQTIDWPTTFPFFFESPSPNDLWGSHLASRGRVGFVNPYEMQYRVGTEIFVSNILADRGIVNGIGTFWEANRQVFDRNTWGNITAVLVETSVCLVICDRDHFTIRYNGNQIQVGANGTLLAQNQEGMFTAPERKAGTNYGCTMADINTIRRFAGIVRWLDTSGYMVLHNFSTAESNTDDAGYLGYVLNKIASVNIKNLTPLVSGKTFFIGGINPKTSEYILTSFNLPVSGSPSYINTDTEPALNNNESLVFDLATSRFKHFASYTPEYFGNMTAYFLQRQFIAFKQGVPYIHNNSFAGSVTPPLYCNFFGTQCEVRITHLVNGVDGKLLPDKVKRFLWTELYVRESVPGASGVMPSALFYADVITSEKGQSSRLLVARWDLKDGYQTAEYLCDLNTPPDPNIPVDTGIHAILDGDPLQGRWLMVSLTNNPSWAGTYFELSEIVNYINGVEKTPE